MAYESRLRLLGLPLVHITTGRIEDGRTGAASPCGRGRKTRSTKWRVPLPSYRVTLHGHLPPSPPDSEVQLRGFYVTRVVDAASAAEAGAAAIRLLHTESKFTRMADAYGQAPEIQVDEVDLAPGSDALAVNRSGYLFYEDE